MSKLAKPFFIVGVILLIIGAYFMWFAPRAHAPEEKIADEILALLHDTESHAVLIAHEGSYYRLALSDLQNGGGISLITRREEDGTLTILWSGQDAPPCDILEEEQVPVAIMDQCYVTNEDGREEKRR